MPTGAKARQQIRRFDAALKGRSSTVVPFCRALPFAPALLPSYFVVGVKVRPSMRSSTSSSVPPITVIEMA
jgi:hypothetical protein